MMDLPGMFLKCRIRRRCTKWGQCSCTGQQSILGDTTGIYDVTTDKCMYIPETIVVPVEPGTGGEITPVLPGGGTIVTPAN